ncbi:hypothetical protein CYG48_00540 [Neorhizobium sp. SOG26]|nr:hypothetical protein CYG48_00540 [Neorhizobium sp. SOG26]
MARVGGISANRFCGFPQLAVRASHFCHRSTQAIKSAEMPLKARDLLTSPGEGSIVPPPPCGRHF